MGSFYEKAVEELFMNIMKVVVCLACIALIGPLLDAANNQLNIISSLVYILMVIISGMIFKSGKKILAYHFFALSSGLLFLVDTLVIQLNFSSIFMIFPCLTFYTFIFLRKLKVQFAYLVFGIFCQFIAVFYLKGGPDNGLTDYIVSEWIYYAVYNMAAFSFCFFFVSNLKKFRNGLNDSKLRLEKLEEDLKQKTTELGERNLQLKNYINNSKKQSAFETLVIEKLTPLGSNIDNFLGMLRPQIHNKLDYKELELLDFVSKNSDNLNKSISGLYEFGFVSKKTLKPELCQVSQLIQEIKMEKFQEIVDRNAYLGCDSCGIEVSGDKSQLKQLFNLLIDNAFYFTPEGIQSQIFIEATDDEHNSYIKVMDNGLGIPEEHRDVVFEIFTQMDSKNPNAGVGVGLSICKKIVEVHKGAIWIEESRFGGACISIQIPKPEVKQNANVNLENIPVLEMSEN